MKPKKGTLFRRGAVAAIAAMLAAGGAAGFETVDAETCVVVSARTLAHGIEVAVANRDARAHTGTIRVLAILDDGELAESEATFAAGAGQTVFVSLGAPGPVRGVIDAGVILDDGPPFNF